MNSLIQNLWNEKHTFYSKSTPDQLKAKLLFSIKSLYKSKLMGKVNEDCSFQLSTLKMGTNWNLRTPEDWDREAAYVSGKLISKSDKTLIIVEVRPNMIMPMFFFAFPIIGLILIASDPDQNLYGGLYFTFGVPILLFFGAKYLKRMIIKQLKKALQI